MTDKVKSIFDNEEVLMQRAMDKYDAQPSADCSDCGIETKILVLTDGVCRRCIRRLERLKSTH